MQAKACFFWCWQRLANKPKTQRLEALGFIDSVIVALLTLSANRAFLLLIPVDYRLTI